MNKATSLYLDVIRFLAALVVVADHVSEPEITGKFLWQLVPYGAEAVTVFFVLSGFVIAHATSTRESSIRTYAIARASRLYSVVLPALVLTFVADAIGRSIDPALYSREYFASPSTADRFIASALFMSELWGLQLNFGSNNPYWSIGYEAWYYAMFAVLTFYSGQRRLVLVLAIATIVGPTILAMLPLWLLGVWIYRLGPLSRRKGIALFLVSVVVWGVYEFIAWRYGRPFVQLPFLERRQLLQDYIVGLCFAGSLIGFRSVTEGLEVRYEWRLVRWLAGATFSIYLYHYPLLMLLTVVNPWPPASWAGRAFVLGVTLFLVFALAEVTERRKEVWRRMMVRLARPSPTAV